MDDRPRRLLELSRDECLRLIAGASFGRIVFTSNAMPAIRPVNHLMDGGAIIIRTRLGTAHRSATGTVVAYEADDIDPVTHTGWSVIVTGLAQLVRKPDEVARYERLLTTWVDGQLNQVIRIEPQLVTGYRLTPDLAGDHPVL